jgi:hypothetical protein
MAAHPVVIIHDGVAEIPEKYKTDPRFRDGASLELVPRETEAPEKPKGDWRALEGILADDGIDTTEWKRQQREWELAHDERKFGTKRPTW